MTDWYFRKFILTTGVRQNQLETGRLVSRLCNSLCEARVVVTERGEGLVLNWLWGCCGAEMRGDRRESSGLCIRGAERRAEVKKEAEKVAQG